MPDYIETFTDGTAAYLGRRSAWHRLGTALGRAFSAEEAMTIGRLGGWDVRKVALPDVPVLGPTGVTMVPVPDRFATVRTNPATSLPEYLGVVGGTYRPVQNEDHCDILNTVADESGAVFETAGSIYGGRQVFVTMKLPQDMTVGGVDRVDLYLAGCNSHDGSTGFTLLLTPIRIVCANTQRAAIAGARQKVTLRHTTNIKARIAEARQALGLTWKWAEAFEREAHKMIQTTMREAEFVRLMRQVFPEPADDATTRVRNTDTQRMSDLLGLWHGPTQAAIAGTRWAGYQAALEYFEHVAPVKTTGDKVLARAEREIGSALDARRKETAFELFTV